MKTIIAKNHQQKAQAAEQIMNHPGVLVISLDEPKRSIPRNSQLHAVLTDIAEQIQWDGEWLTVEQWKRLLTAAWMRATNRQIKLVRSIDGTGVEPLYQGTRDLNESECRELIQYVYAWGVDSNVIFKEPTPEGWRRPQVAA